MTLIVCLDDRNGMSYNGRRQSRDSALCRDVEELSCGRLLVNAYSQKLFPGADICPDPLKAAGTEDFCFVEDIDVSPFLEKANRLIVYRWNRHYPADVVFPQGELEKWQLTERIEFPGSSHEIITREVYIR